MATTELYPYLILVGASILLAAGWLLHQYRTQLQHTRELIRLNEEFGYDLPNFLRQCWPIVGKSSFSGMDWQLDWFGTHLEGKQGESGASRIDKTFEAQEIKLQLTLHRQKGGLERHYFADALADSFFLLLRMNLWIKVGTVQGAFEQAAKMNVFLKHDVKNMVQLLRLSNEQLLEPEAGHQEVVLEGLKTAIPAVLERAEHMLRSLNEGPGLQRASRVADPQLLDLREALEQAAALYDINMEIDGSGMVFLEREALLSIIDNLLGNYSRQARGKRERRPLLAVRLYQNGNTLRAVIRDLHGKPFPWPERLFEPFWSEYGDGRGIGLYQARQRAQAVGGSLEANAEAEQPLVFSLSLPTGPSKPPHAL